MNVIEKFKEITEFLDRCGIDAPEKEAEILMKYGLGIDILKIYKERTLLSEVECNSISNMLMRRALREPLQYIVGYEDFFGLRIMVGGGVLIPRPETEFMAEQAIKTVKSQKTEVRSQIQSLPQAPNSELTILDIGTGSGCLALALAKAFPGDDVYGTDISEIAIEYAERNAEINGIGNVTFLKGDLFEPINKLLTSHFSLLTFDLIISNPPYIKTDDIKNLQPEIRDWEPLNALDGGMDGLDFYRRIIPEARCHLKRDGILMFEIGAGYLTRVIEIFEGAGYKNIEVLRDYAGVERVIQAQWEN